MGMHIAIIWQRFLPYHIARINHLREELSPFGYEVTAIEVTSQDASYGFPEGVFSENSFKHICCFPKMSYHQLKPAVIHNKVFSLLMECKPDVSFAPAAPFPEGMAAFAYRNRCEARAVMMDDAWDHTDNRGSLTKGIKRLIHRNIDAVFIPASSHLAYFSNMGFPEDRIVFGVDVVDNNYFLRKSEEARANNENVRASKKLPKNYFLFVGRFLPRKDLETLIEAYTNYRQQTGQNPWGLVLVGDGRNLENIRSLSRDVTGIIFAGPQFSDSLCQYYALARALIVPSISDPWGLVVNEGMASGLPVIVSRGCGAAKTLVREGENGWTFEPGDDETLTKLMINASSLPSEALKEMGRKSQSIISEWSLDRFADGVLKAIKIPRRPPAGILSDILTRMWKGHVRVN
jgi:glycosyltransferase involved in cell wall biosynthesis